ncbi:MAG: dihydrofolate reductase [Leptolyngbyaceae cyanobacterium RM1_406_9]|nr:dihydrofolate reductase [Leptolyngbyaceae cyanobacterium RM1_406_9]
MKKTEVVIIAAIAESNRVIGKNGKLPWRIPQDSKRFQDITLGYPVIMGRKTWEYDIEKCPLVKRFNIVISSCPEQESVSEHCRSYPFELAFVNSIQEALKNAEDREKAFIVGGASIYSQSLNLADTLELTLVEGSFEGDTFFPNYEHLIGSQFKLVSRETHPGFRYETYRRICYSHTRTYSDPK